MTATINAFAGHARTCVYCTATFRSKTTRAKYCSQACKRSYRLGRKPYAIVGGEWRKCGHCSGEFLTFDRRRLYCDGLCKRRACELNRTSRKVRKGVAVTVECIGCGSTFETDDARRRHCSGACCYQHRKASNALREREKSAALRALVIPKPCGYCGGEIDGFTWRKVYCCDACKVHARNVRKRKGLPENPPAPVIKRPKHKPKPVRIITPKPVKAAPVEPVEEKIPAYKIGKPTGHGYGFSGYSESKPRGATSTVSGCPHCRRYGTDTLGRQQHHSFCREFAA